MTHRFAAAYLGHRAPSVPYIPNYLLLLGYPHYGTRTSTTIVQWDVQNSEFCDSNKK